MAAPTKFGILAGIDEAFAIGFRQLAEVAVVPVITLEITRQQRAQRVMKIVVPLPIECISAALALLYQTRIVIGALRNEIDLAVEPQRFPFHRLDQLFDKGNRRMIENGVHGIEPERVDMKLADPLERILNEIVAHLVTVRSIEVDRAAPRRLITVREVGTEVAKVVSFRAEVVVNDIQDNREPASVAGIDELL